MFRKYVHKNVFWYDFKNTHQKEFFDVSLPHAINSDLIKRLLSRSEKQEFIEHDKDTYISLHIPTIDAQGHVQSSCLKIIMSHDFLITSRQTSVSGFRDAKKKLNPESQRQGTTTEILSILFQEIFESIYYVIKHQTRMLTKTRKAILSSQYVSKQYVHALNSSVLEVYDILDSQVNVLHALRKEEDITTKHLIKILNGFDDILFRARWNVESIIDQKLLFKQALIRERKLKTLKVLAFILVFFSLLFVALTAL